MKRYSYLIIALLCIAMFVPASAQKIEFTGIGAKAGIVLPESPFDNLGLQFGANAYLGELSDGLYWVMGLNYWTVSNDENGFDQTLSNFQIMEDVHYYLSGKPEGAFVGGGISYNLLSWEATVDLGFLGTTTISTDDSKIGFHPLAGYVFQLGEMNAFVEAKYNLISNFNTLDVVFGVNFDM